LVPPLANWVETPGNPYPTGGRNAGMPADLREKTDRYERLLAEGLEVAEPVQAADSPLDDAADACLGMAESYLEDGRHFLADDDPVNALAAFSYGHGWLDAGARIGLFEIPEGDHPFAI
jgi:hypothetical protein